MHEFDDIGVQRASHKPTGSRCSAVAFKLSKPQPSARDAVNAARFLLKRYVRESLHAQNRYRRHDSKLPSARAAHVDQHLHQAPVVRNVSTLARLERDSHSVVVVKQTSYRHLTIRKRS